MIVFDEPEAAEPRRGLRVCPECARRSLRRHRGSTDSRAIPSKRGAVVAKRTYGCETPGCETHVVFYEISGGRTTRKSTRNRSDLRPEEALEPAAIAIVFPDRIVLKI